MTVKYRYTARSANDPNGEKGGLGYHDLESAQRHVDDMNKLRATWPATPWNIEFWKTQPGEWAVYQDEK